MLEYIKTQLLLGVAHAQIDKNLETELGSKEGLYQKLSPIKDPSGAITIGSLIETIINIILYVAGIVAVIYLLYAGIAYITSAGDEAKATKARQGIINAVIGIIIILLAFVIEGAVARIFKS